MIDQRRRGERGQACRDRHAVFAGRHIEQERPNEGPAALVNPRPCGNEGLLALRGDLV